MPRDLEHWGHCVNPHVILGKFLLEGREGRHFLRRLGKHGVFVSFFTAGMNWPTRNNIWKSLFYLAHHLRGAVCHGGKGVTVGTQGSWSHIVSAAMNGERETDAGVVVAFPCPLCVPYRAPVHRMVLPTFRMGLPPEGGKSL